MSDQNDKKEEGGQKPPEPPQPEPEKGHRPDDIRVITRGAEVGDVAMMRNKAKVWSRGQDPNAPEEKGNQK